MSRQVEETKELKTSMKKGKHELLEKSLGNIKIKI